MTSPRLVMKVAPQTLLSAGLGYLLLLILTSTLAALNSPWLGVKLTAPDQTGSQILTVHPNSPAHEVLQAGQRLTHISQDQQQVRLDPQLMVAEPDDASDYHSYWATFAANRQLHQMLIQGPVQIHTDSEPVSLQAASTRPLSALPLLYWYQIFCATAVFVMGIAVAAFVPHDRSALLYAAAALGLSLAMAASAIYTTRELVLHPTLFPLLSRINQFGAMLFATCGTAMLWYFPRRLGNFPFTRVALLIMALFLSINYFQLTDSLDLAVRVTLFFWLITDIVLAAMQWHRTRQAPIGRARLKWYIYSWFSGVISYLALVILPQLFGAESIVHQSYGWGFFVLTYGGIALGIIQYRLFDLDRWIMGAWFWFLCGAAIIVIDVLLVILLRTNPYLTVTMTIALMGWLYFPLRQWFMQRLSPAHHRRDSAERLRQQMIRDAFSHQGSLEQQWREGLKRLFRPLTITPSAAQPAQHRGQLLENGLRLRLPSLGNAPALELGYADNGRRLFNHQDLELVNEFSVLFEHAREYRHNFFSTVHEERERVAQDLHDDVGAKLLSIVYRADDPQQQQLARDALSSLRQVIQDLQQPSQPLRQAVEQWQQETASRLDTLGIELAVHRRLHDPDWPLPPRLCKALTLALREATSNILKHAHASQAILRVRTDSQNLTLNFEDNGQGLESSQSSHGGCGIINIDKRISANGGTVCWYTPEQGGTGLLMTVPLHQETAP